MEITHTNFSTCSVLAPGKHTHTHFRTCSVVAHGKDIYTLQDMLGGAAVLIST